MKRLLTALSLLTSLTALLGQSNVVVTNIGYVYPAGGCRGTTVDVLVGGQFLRNVESVRITGEGVTAEVIEFYAPMRNMNSDARKIVRWQLAHRLNELTGKPIPQRTRKEYEEMTEAERENGKLRPHPTLSRISELNIWDLTHLMDLRREANKRQPNAQIDERFGVLITNHPRGPVGDRELRLISKRGISNPLRFQVTRIEEVMEQEPNDKLLEKLPPLPLIDLPVAINGQILPGDLDRFTFRARRGQRILAEVMARRLIPYLADAVPGWFQATLALYDAQGNEVAFADDDFFSPDPVLEYEIPDDGEYTIEIRDAIFRGREDFVYRLLITESRLQEHRLLYQDVNYKTNDIPVVAEETSNDTLDSAQPVALPALVIGNIARPGDTDYYRFQALPGMELIAQIEGRCFKSPIDSLIRVLDPNDKVVAWNDDFMHKSGHMHTGPGLITHHADSYLRTTLKRGGDYTIMVQDTQRQGGADHRYRLRLSEPMPGFEVRATPSFVNLDAACVPLRVYAARKDGFEGPIKVRIAEPQEGFILKGSTIPAGKESVLMTLQKTDSKQRGIFTLKLEAAAVVDGKTVAREVIPADDTMQAFLWRHLVPATEMLAIETGRGRRITQELAVRPEVVSLGNDTGATVSINLPKEYYRKALKFKLKDAPRGITLKDTTYSWAKQNLLLNLKCDEIPPDAADDGNLIVEIYVEQKLGNSGKIRLIPQGVLPAIHYQLNPS